MGKRRAPRTDRPRGRGPLVAACAALAVCLLVTGGLVYVANRISAALDAWSGPSAADGRVPEDGSIETPPHDGLTAPPSTSEVTPDEGSGSERGEAAAGAGTGTGTGADEQQTPASAPRPSGDWLDEVAESTTIPRRALEGYASAQLVLAEEEPSCRLSWPTLAGIGYVETKHGTHGGGEIGSDGLTTIDIIGIPLDGTNNTRAIPDTDGGRYDDDTEWDRAVGPMQFIPSTWERWGTSLEGGDPDPRSIDDAALSAGRYLCGGGRDLTSARDWESAILTYNSSRTYLDDVLAYAHAYADAS
ncbi:lytic transglycosylase domain-containing protein [Nocardiopsis sp. NRRL B-16309]|uniref:lytic transglycosylase domain-containing protein n=1 Tax=Nocardiopsis sp. NRRL B-16309 TaxID=1519494 RepID=UPI0006B0253F|nr:lytic transglycosylase domain-containing protein [Nocardiopsis sp. NRRL B-16309]KOX20779.1 murein transglycosylase [Nocardiopsis sp. NRRL B-16309]